MCLPGEDGEPELLLGQGAVRQPGSVYVPSGGSGGRRGWSLHSGSHCAHHRAYIQVNVLKSKTLSLYLRCIYLSLTKTWFCQEKEQTGHERLQEGTDPA